MEIAKIGMPAANLLDQVARTAFGTVGNAGRSTSASSTAATGSDFAAMIQQSLAQVNGTQAQAEIAAQQYQLGQNGVSLEDAMISMQKANINFQTTVQVRNKLVAAYNDVMNMQV